MMADVGKREKSGKTLKKMRESSWLWPLGVAATSVTGVVLLALRGCWHRRMSWPVRMQDHSYQVCLECGAKRLFDEKKFSSYGPFRYDLNELIAWERAKKQKPGDRAPLLPSEIASPTIIPPIIPPKVVAS